MRPLTFAGSLVAVLTVASGQDLPYAIGCRRPAGLVEFDGRLNDAAWSEAPEIAVSLDAPDEPGATFRFLADDRSLYVGWAAAVPPGQEVVRRGLVPVPPGAETFERVAVILRPGAGCREDAARPGVGAREEIRWQVGAGGQLRVTRGTTLLGDVPEGRVETVVSPGQWSGELILPRAILDATPDIDSICVEHVLRRTPSSRAEGRSAFHPVLLPVALASVTAPSTNLVEAAWVPGVDRIELPRTIGAEDWTGPALRMLCIGPPRGIAETVDLGRRYEIETAFVGWDAAAEEAPQAKTAARIENLLGYRWDVVLVGNIPWSSLPVAVRTRILGNVVDGMGLVTSRTGDGGRSGPWDAVAPSPDAGADAAAVPRLVADLPPAAQSSRGEMAVFRLGRGRVVRLDRKDPVGGFAVAVPTVAWHREDAPLLREDWMSVVARSLRWAAGLDLLDLAVSPASIRWQAGSGPDARRWTLQPGSREAPATLETVIYDADLGVVDVRETEIDTPRFDRFGRTMFLPALPPGRYRLVSRMRDAEVVAGWARTTLAVDNAVEGLRASARWQMDRPPLGDGPAAAELHLSGLPGDRADNDTAVVRVRDGTGRLLAEQEIELAKTDDASLQIPIQVIPPATDVCTLVVDYTRGGQILARTQATLQGAPPVLPRPALWIVAPAVDDWWLRSLLSAIWPLDRRQVSWIEPVDSPNARLRTERDLRLGFRPILWVDAPGSLPGTPTNALPSDPSLRRLAGPRRTAGTPTSVSTGQGSPLTVVGDDLGGWPDVLDAGILFPAVVSLDHPRVHRDLRAASSGSGLDIDDRTLPITSAARWAPWECVLRGGGVIAVGIRAPAGLIAADLRPTATASALGEELRILQRGLGELIIRAGRPHHDGMAILWSEASALQAAAGLVAHGSVEPPHLVEAAAIAACLGSLGYAPAVIEEDRLLDDPALLDEFRVLWLPWATTLHAETVAILRAFVGSGGTVVADGQPGAYPAEGPRRDLQPAMANDFGVEYAAQDMRPTPVKVRSVPANPATEFDALCDGAVRPRLAEPQQTASGVPIVAVRPDRRGRWVYLNLWMEDAWHIDSPEAAGLRGLVRVLLAGWGAPTPRAVVLAADGAPSPDCRVARLAWGRRCEIIVAARIPHVQQPPSRDLTLRLDGIRSLYDLRTGSRLASTDRLILGPTAPGATRIFAAWNGRPPSLTVTPTTRRATALQPARVRVRSEEPPLACHIEIVDADGRSRPEYAGILLSPTGEAEHGFTPAYDDPSGEWEIVVRNLVTDEIEIVLLPVIPRAKG